ncbi:fructose-bisphosphatase class II [Kocuria rhizophila]|nr:fructose-bisphosphatase class II [Kocuria rhizophila]
MLGTNNALAVIAAAVWRLHVRPLGRVFTGQARGGPRGRGHGGLRLPVKQNIHRRPRPGVKPNQVTVCVLAPPAPPGDSWRRFAPRVPAPRIHPDGTWPGAIAARREGNLSGHDDGHLAAPEGIVTACAVKATGGVIQGRLAPTDETERQKAEEAGLDVDRTSPRTSRDLRQSASSPPPASRTATCCGVCATAAAPSPRSPS